MLLEKMLYLKIIQTVIMNLSVTLKLLLAKLESGRTMHTRITTILVIYHMTLKMIQTNNNKPLVRNHTLEVEEKENNF